MALYDYVLRYLFTLWGFLLPPDIPPDEDMLMAFEQLWQLTESEAVLDYDLPYEKTTLTRWLVAEKGVLLHGSNRAEINELTHRKQTNFNGK